MWKLAYGELKAICTSVWGRIIHILNFFIPLGYAEGIFWSIYVIFTPGLVVDFKLDGLANFSASISIVPTSSHYRGASCAFPIFSDIAKACLWAGATSYLAIGLLKSNSCVWYGPVFRSYVPVFRSYIVKGHYSIFSSCILRRRT